METVHRYEAIRKIKRAAMRLHDTKLQRRLAALQAEAVHRAEEDARRWRRGPEPAVAVGRRGTLSFRDDVFWLKEGEVEEGPLCPGCWGREHHAVLMQVSVETWSCPACHRAARMPDLLENRRPPGRPCHAVSGIETPRRDLAPLREIP
jgi:hypothetical protein